MTPLDTNTRLCLFIQVFTETHGYAPMVREVRAALGFASTSPVWQRLFALRRRGVLTWSDGASRTLRLWRVRDAVAAERRLHQEYAARRVAREHFALSERELKALVRRRGL